MTKKKDEANEPVKPVTKFVGIGGTEEVVVAPVESAPTTEVVTTPQEEDPK